MRAGGVPAPRSPHTTAPKGAVGLGSMGWQPKGRLGGGCGGRSGEKGSGMLSTQAGGCWWGLAAPRGGFGALFWQGCLVGGERSWERVAQECPSERDAEQRLEQMQPSVHTSPGTRIPLGANGIRAWRMCRGVPRYQPRGPRLSWKPTKAGGRRKRRRRKSRTWSSAGDSGSSVGTRPGAQLSTSGRFTFRSLPLGFSPTVLFRSWELPFNSSRKQLRNLCFF